MNGANSAADFVRSVAAAVSAGDLFNASEIASAALRSGIRHPALFNARALWLQAQGQFPEALNEFGQARQMMPRDVTLLNAIGMCYVRCGRIAEGIAAFDDAIGLAPNLPMTHFRKGWAYTSAGDPEAARASYLRAIELKPDYAEALAALASLAARDGATDLARDYAGRSLRIDPKEPTAITALAIVENAAGNFQHSEEFLRQALKDRRAAGHTKAVLLGFLGDALDGQNRFAEAFAAYSQKAEEFRALHAPRLAGIPPIAENLDRLAAYLASVPAEKRCPASRAEAMEGAPREHAFLLGFMRSGTTLLEQALGSHSDVASLEERDTFAELSPRYMRAPESLGRLLDLEGPALDEERRTYWESVRKFGAEPAGKVFIDKQPLNAFNLPLIARLFPEAKVLFALRDPRDVLLSCFRRHFEVSPTTYPFLDLKSGASFYAAVMRFAETCRTNLPLHVLDHRYENMIEDFESAMRRVCAFLNIEWQDSMREFSEAARHRTIRSPSARQVRKPLYRQGAGYWRNYAGHLAPALPILQPWVEKFSYPPN